MNKKRQIAILGSTGSIGTQALQVIEEHADLFEARVLTANNRVDELIQQSRRFQPAAVVIANDAHYERLRDALADLPIQVYAGSEALCQVVQSSEVDMVLTAMVGFAGLPPTIAAIKARKPIALANKETMVVAGELINRLCHEYQVPILPVDSEHSAIFQCLMGESSPVERIILTASGGPFRAFTKEQLASVTPAMALKHPNWDMGAKITIDSATLMNKGFEVIEAKWLFNQPPHKIQVLIHPQSIIHSAVQFCDGSVKAQLGLPDMRLPIQYALSFPERLPLNVPRLDFFKNQPLEFFEPDVEKFQCLQLAFQAIEKGGNMPCILNAANEVVNYAFRVGKCTFPQIPQIISETMQRTTFDPTPTLDTYFNTDDQARRIANEILSEI